MDYIMPQLYWGFETKDSSEILPMLIQPLKMHVDKTLAVRFWSIDMWVWIWPTSNGSADEMLRLKCLHNDIIARQVMTGRTTGKVGD